MKQYVSISTLSALQFEWKKINGFSLFVAFGLDHCSIVSKLSKSQSLDESK